MNESRLIVGPLVAIWTATPLDSKLGVRLAECCVFESYEDIPGVGERALRDRGETETAGDRCVRLGVVLASLIGEAEEEDEVGDEDEGGEVV